MVCVARCRCHLSSSTGSGVTDVTPVHGGDIARAYRWTRRMVRCSPRPIPTPKPSMFEREAAGLRALRAADAVAVPEVVRETPSGLVLEWIDVGRPDAGRGRRAFGAELAALHRVDWAALRRA